MNDGGRSFNDYVYGGMDSILKFTARAGDSLRVASNTAIERIDLARLERRQETLYASLGKRVCLLLSEGGSPDFREISLARIVDDITKVSEEIRRRKSIEPILEENEKIEKKN